MHAVEGVEMPRFWKRAIPLTQPTWHRSIYIYTKPWSRSIKIDAFLLSKIIYTIYMVHQLGKRNYTFWKHDEIKSSIHFLLHIWDFLWVVTNSRSYEFERLILSVLILKGWWWLCVGYSYPSENLLSWKCVCIQYTRVKQEKCWHLKNHAPVNFHRESSKDVFCKHVLHIYETVKGSL